MSQSFDLDQIDSDLGDLLDWIGDVQTVRHDDVNNNQGEINNHEDILDTNTLSREEMDVSMHDFIMDGEQEAWMASVETVIPLDTLELEQLLDDLKDNSFAKTNPSIRESSDAINFNVEESLEPNAIDSTDCNPNITNEVLISDIDGNDIIAVDVVQSQEATEKTDPQIYESSDDTNVNAEGSSEPIAADSADLTSNIIDEVIIPDIDGTDIIGLDVVQSQEVTEKTNPVIFERSDDTNVNAEGSSEPIAVDHADLTSDIIDEVIIPDIGSTDIIGLDIVQLQEATEKTNLAICESSDDTNVNAEGSSEPIAVDNADLTSNIIDEVIIDIGSTDIIGLDIVQSQEATEKTNPEIFVNAEGSSEPIAVDNTDLTSNIIDEVIIPDIGSTDIIGLDIVQLQEATEKTNLAICESSDDTNVNAEGSSEPIAVDNADLTSNIIDEVIIDIGSTDIIGLDIVQSQEATEKTNPEIFVNAEGSSEPIAVDNADLTSDIIDEVIIPDIGSTDIIGLDIVQLQEATEKTNLAICESSDDTNVNAKGSSEPIAVDNADLTSNIIDEVIIDIGSTDIIGLDIVQSQEATEKTNPEIFVNAEGSSEPIAVDNTDLTSNIIDEVIIPDIGSTDIIGLDIVQLQEATEKTNPAICESSDDSTVNAEGSSEPIAVDNADLTSDIIDEVIIDIGSTDIIGLDVVQSQEATEKTNPEIFVNAEGSSEPIAVDNTDLTSNIIDEVIIPDIGSTDIIGLDIVQLQEATEKTNLAICESSDDTNVNAEGSSEPIAVDNADLTSDIIDEVIIDIGSTDIIAVDVVQSQEATEKTNLAICERSDDTNVNAEGSSEPIAVDNADLTSNIIDEVIIDIGSTDIIGLDIVQSQEATEKTNLAICESSDEMTFCIQESLEPIAADNADLTSNIIDEVIIDIGSTDIIGLDIVQSQEGTEKTNLAICEGSDEMTFCIQESLEPIAVDNTDLTSDIIDEVIIDIGSTAIIGLDIVQSQEATEKTNPAICESSDDSTVNAEGSSEPIAVDNTDLTSNIIDEVLNSEIDGIDIIDLDIVESQEATEKTNPAICESSDEMTFCIQESLEPIAAGSADLTPDHEVSDYLCDVAPPQVITMKTSSVICESSDDSTVNAEGSSEPIAVDNADLTSDIIDEVLNSDIDGIDIIDLDIVESQEATEKTNPAICESSDEMTFCIQESLEPIAAGSADLTPDHEVSDYLGDVAPPQVITMKTSSVICESSDDSTVNAEGSSEPIAADSADLTSDIIDEVIIPDIDGTDIIGLDVVQSQEAAEKTNPEIFESSDDTNVNAEGSSEPIAVDSADLIPDIIDEVMIPNNDDTVIVGLAVDQSQEGATKTNPEIYKSSDDTNVNAEGSELILDIGSIDIVGLDVVPLSDVIKKVNSPEQVMDFHDAIQQPEGKSKKSRRNRKKKKSKRDRKNENVQIDKPDNEVLIPDIDGIDIIGPNTTQPEEVTNSTRNDSCDDPNVNAERSLEPIAADSAGLIPDIDGNHITGPDVTPSQEITTKTNPAICGRSDDANLNAEGSLEPIAVDSADVSPDITDEVMIPQHEVLIPDNDCNHISGLDVTTSQEVTWKTNQSIYKRSDDAIVNAEGLLESIAIESADLIPDIDVSHFLGDVVQSEEGATKTNVYYNQGEINNHEDILDTNTLARGEMDVSVHDFIIDGEKEASMTSVVTVNPPEQVMDFHDAIQQPEGKSKKSRRNRKKKKSKRDRKNENVQIDKPDNEVLIPDIDGIDIIGPNTTQPEEVTNSTRNDSCDNPNVNAERSLEPIAADSAGLIPDIDGKHITGPDVTPSQEITTKTNPAICGRSDDTNFNAEGSSEPIAIDSADVIPDITDEVMTPDIDGNHISGLDVTTSQEVTWKTNQSLYKRCVNAYGSLEPITIESADVIPDITDKVMTPDIDGNHISGLDVTTSQEVTWKTNQSIYKRSDDAIVNAYGSLGPIAIDSADLIPDIDVSHFLGDVVQSEEGATKTNVYYNQGEINNHEDILDTNTLSREEMDVSMHDFIMDGEQEASMTSVVTVIPLETLELEQLLDDLKDNSFTKMKPVISDETTLSLKGSLGPIATDSADFITDHQVLISDIDVSDRIGLDIVQPQEITTGAFSIQESLEPIAIDRTDLTPDHDVLSPNIDVSDIVGVYVVQSQEVRMAMNVAKYVKSDDTTFSIQESLEPIAIDSADLIAGIDIIGLDVVSLQKVTAKVNPPEQVMDFHDAIQQPEGKSKKSRRNRKKKKAKRDRKNENVQIDKPDNEVLIPDIDGIDIIGPNTTQPEELTNSARNDSCDNPNVNAERSLEPIAADSADLILNIIDEVLIPDIDGKHITGPDVTPSQEITTKTNPAICGRSDDTNFNAYRSLESIAIDSADVIPDITDEVMIPQHEVLIPDNDCTDIVGLDIAQSQEVITKTNPAICERSDDTNCNAEGSFEPIAIESADLITDHDVLIPDIDRIDILGLDVIPTQEITVKTDPAVCERSDDTNVNAEGLLERIVEESAHLIPSSCVEGLDVTTPQEITTKTNPAICESSDDKTVRIQESSEPIAADSADVIPDVDGIDSVGLDVVQSEKVATKTNRSICKWSVDTTFNTEESLQPMAIDNADLIPDINLLNTAFPTRIKISQKELDQLMIAEGCSFLSRECDDVTAWHCLRQLLRDHIDGSRNSTDIDATELCFIATLDIWGNYKYLDGSNETTSICRVESDVTSDNLLGSYTEFATFYASLGQWSAALDVLHTLLLKCEHHLPPRHPFTITTFLDLAAISFNMNDETGSIAFINRARRSLTQYFAEEQEFFRTYHFNTISSEGNSNKKGLSREELIEKLNKFEEYIYNLRSYMGRSTLRALGADHPVYLLSLCFIADAFMVHAHCDETMFPSVGGCSEHSTSHKSMTIAGQYYRLALRGWMNGFGVTHPSVPTTACSLARCLHKINQSAESVTLLTRVVEAVYELSQGQHRMSTASHHAIAECLWLLAAYSSENQNSLEGRRNAMRYLHAASQELRLIDPERTGNDELNFSSEMLLTIEFEARLLFSLPSHQA